MSYLKIRRSAVALAMMAAAWWACLAPEIFAQGRQAIVILKSVGGATSDCEGAAEINYQVVFDLKLNNKDKVRLITEETIRSGSDRITRQIYDKAKSQDLRSFFAIECGREGVCGVVSGSGQSPTPLLPDSQRPERNEAPAIRDFYSVMVTGEARDGRRRQPVSLTLRDVWKIYFTAEGAAASDSLFNHAAAEKSVALWEAYLKKTSNHRASEANGLMREALLACANVELESFLNGDYRAIERARSKAERAHSVREDQASTQLLARLRSEKQRVDNARGQADSLIRASDWDKALDAIEPIKAYLASWPELKQMFEHALRQSHETHLFEGEKSLKANQFDSALNHCSVAWKRLPDSAKARDCVCESRKQVALRKAQSARKQQRPKEAKEILENQLGDRDCGADARLTAELGKAKCEYAQQLFAQAHQLIAFGAAAPAPTPTKTQPTRNQGRPRPSRPASASSGNFASVSTPIVFKPLTAQNKNDFREARAKLIEAEGLCADEPTRTRQRTLLEIANRSLSGYCLAEARKAMQRGAAATAYVYLQTAQTYTPSEPAVLEAVNQAQRQLEAQTRVGVGVVVRDNSHSGAGSIVLNELASELEGLAMQAGFANPVVLDRSQAAAALQAMQTGRALPTPVAIFSSDLLAADVRSSRTPRNVRSTYSQDNPAYQRADAIYAEAKAQHENCRRQYGDANCEQYRIRREQTDANRRQYPKHLEREYYYRETMIRVTGALRLTYRAANNIARNLGSAETLSDNISQECLQREGVHENERSWGTSNTSCQLADEGAYLSQMLTNVKREARSRALAYLQTLPASYYHRAQSNPNQLPAAEDYLRFLFLTANKNSREAEEAKRALVAFDPELQTDGVLR